MVSPRKRNSMVGRMRSITKGKSDSPEEWVPGGDFRFTESPAIAKRESNKRRTCNFGKQNESAIKNRRLSHVLKNLEIAMVGTVSSPTNVRRTRRQSMAVTSVSQRKLIEDAVSSAVEKNVVKQHKFKLPPKRGAPLQSNNAATQSKSNVMKNVRVTLSPLSFYSSPNKQKSPNFGSPKIAGKRKVESEDMTDKMEPSKKKSKDASLANKENRSSLRRQDASSILSTKLSLSDKSSTSKNAEKTHPSPSKKVLRSSIPRRSVRSQSTVVSPDTAKAKVKGKSPQVKQAGKVMEKADSPTNKVKSTKIQKRNVNTTTLVENIKSPGNQKMLLKSAEKKVALRSTRNTSQRKLISVLSLPVDPSEKQVLMSSTKETPQKVSPKRKVITPPKIQVEIDEKKNPLKTPRAKDSPPVAGKGKSTKQKVTPIKEAAKRTASPLTSNSSPSSQVESPVSKTKTPDVKKCNLNQKNKTPTPKNEPKATLLKKSTPTSSSKKSPISKTPEKAKGNTTGKRATRSTVKIIKKVSIVGGSPQTEASSFRKTPALKKTPFKDNDLGSSPLLSARSQLELIRIRSPIRSVKRIQKMKAKPYTPKPDSPPSNVLKKNLKDRISQQMKAVTQVEVHQLMNGEISKPIRITATTTNTSSKSVIFESRIKTPMTAITPRKPIGSVILNGGDPDIKNLAATPVSVSNLPPTPTSSRKLSESVLMKRHVTSQSVSKISCQRSLTLTPTTPRSSTPIEEDSILEPLRLGAVFNKGENETNFTDDSINTDTSDTETSLMESKEIKSPSAENPKKWGCMLM